MPYIVSETEHKTQLEARFWNDNGNNIAIVADITKKVNWAAYVGAIIAQTEREAIQSALEHGCKLSEDDARHFFPGIQLPYRH